MDEESIRRTLQLAGLDERGAEIRMVKERTRCYRTIESDEFPQKMSYAYFFPSQSTGGL